MTKTYKKTLKSLYFITFFSASILSTVSVETNGAYESRLNMPMCIIKKIDAWPSYLILLFIVFVLIYANAICKYKTHIFCHLGLLQLRFALWSFRSVKRYDTYTYMWAF